MKKILALMLAFAMLFALCACGQSATTATAAPTDTQAPATEAPETEAPATETPADAAEVTPLPEAPEITTVTPGTLTVATSADFSPYEFHIMKDGQDTIVGFDMALAQAIADYLGLELVIKDMDFDSIITEVQMGTVDMALAGFSVQPERAEVIDFTDVYYTGGQSFVYLAKNADKYKSYDDLKGLGVAAQAGTIQADLLTENCPDSQQVLLADMNDIIMELLAGKVEGAFVETVVAQNYIKNYPDLQIAWDVPYDSTGSAAVVQKGNDALREAANNVISYVTANGDFGTWVEEAMDLSDQAAS